MHRTKNLELDRDLLNSLKVHLKPSKFGPLSTALRGLDDMNLDKAAHENLRRQLLDKSGIPLEIQDTVYNVVTNKPISYKVGSTTTKMGAAQAYWNYLEDQRKRYVSEIEGSTFRTARAHDIRAERIEKLQRPLEDLIHERPRPEATIRPTALPHPEDAPLRKKAGAPKPLRLEVGPLSEDPLLNEETFRTRTDQQRFRERTLEDIDRAEARIVHAINNAKDPNFKETLSESYNKVRERFAAMRNDPEASVFTVDIGKDGRIYLKKTPHTIHAPVKNLLSPAAERRLTKVAGSASPRVLPAAPKGLPDADDALRPPRYPATSDWESVLKVARKDPQNLDVKSLVPLFEQMHGREVRASDIDDLLELAEQTGVRIGDPSNFLEKNFRHDPRDVDPRKGSLTLRRRGIFGSPGEWERPRPAPAIPPKHEGLVTPSMLRGGSDPSKLPRVAALPQKEWWKEVPATKKPVPIAKVTGSEILRRPLGSSNWRRLGAPALAGALFAYGISPILDRLGALPRIPTAA